MVSDRTSRIAPDNSALDSLELLKAELEGFGKVNDATTSDPHRRMLNITRDTGQLLQVLVLATAAQRVLEIGTSNGYSTLWLAESVRTIGGMVTTIECDTDKTDLASVNFARAGLSSFITQVQDDAARFLEKTDENVYDLIFLDSDRAAYARWWVHLRSILRPRGLLIVDNATSHEQQMAPLVALATADTNFASCLVPVGKGQFLVVKTTP